MEEELTKKLADKLMKTEGATRGFNLEHDREWILKEKGEEGLKKVEKELERIGRPIHYKQLKTMDFYPAGMRALSLLAIKKVFDLSKEEIKEVFVSHAKRSLIVKLFAKYFYSLSLTLRKTSEMWERYWTKGELVTEKHSPEEKLVVLRLKDFELHPLFCYCLEGYFVTIAELVTGSKEVRCRETKCTFEGAPYHEFIIEY